MIAAERAAWAGALSPGPEGSQSVVYKGRLLGVASPVMEAPATHSIDTDLVVAAKALKHTDTVSVLKHSDTVESIKHTVGVLEHTDTVGALPSLERQCRPATKKCSLPAVPRLSLGEGGRLLDEGGGRCGKNASKESNWPLHMGDSRCEVTQSLESAVRKLSRTSPSRPGDLGGIRAGLAILARGYEQYREGIQLLRPTEFGEASSDDLSSEWESSDLETSPSSTGGERQHYPLPVLPPSLPGLAPRARWRKVRSAVTWSPFVQQFKEQKYDWVQLAGHSGNFRAGRTQGTVLKKLSAAEECIYKRLMKDEALRQFVPVFHKSLILDDDEQFIELEDCLASFTSPCIMDCKVGVRTYLEEELAKAREKPKLRKDMYEKMVAVDPEAPTAQEHLLKGVTKPRYMVWRETISSTATLGFRIDGIQKDGNSSKDFKTTSTKEQVVTCFKTFLVDSPHVLSLYLARLNAIRLALDSSDFFKGHELIGSSLLFVHDDNSANIWLIDFGKTVAVPSDMEINHKSAWEVGNHEDGYLIGLDNIISIFKEMAEAD